MSSRWRLLGGIIGILGQIAGGSDTSSTLSKETNRNYLSDTDRVACFLETVQRQAQGLDDPNWAFDDRQQAIVDQAIDRLSGPGSPIGAQDRQLIVEALRSVRLPTRFENPMSQWLLVRSLEQLQAVLPRLNHASPGRILIGSINSGDINADRKSAQAFTCPNARATSSEYVNDVIIVNTRALAFVGEAAHVASSAIPIEMVGDQVSISFDNETIRRNISQHPELAENFLRAILEFSLIAHMEPGQRSPIHFQIVHRIEAGADLFIVGHELAHIVLRHPLVAPTGTSRGQALALMWRAELEADIMALQLIQAATAQALSARDDDLDRVMRPLTTLAPLIFLQSQGMLERTQAIFDSGQDVEPSQEERDAVLAILRTSAGRSGEGPPVPEALIERFTSHPPFWLRQMFMEEALRVQLSSSPPASNEERQFYNMAIQIVRLQEMLFQQVRPALLRARQLATQTRQRAQ